MRKSLNTLPITVFRFGLDYIRFNLSPDFPAVAFNSLMAGLSANSAQAFGVKYLGQEVDILMTDTRHKRILTLSYFGDAIMCIEKILDGGIVSNVSWTVTFYSSYFYVNRIQNMLPDFINTYYEYLTVARVDLALDIDYPVEKLWKRHRTQFVNKLPYINRGKIETFYLGKKTNNKNHFIRVYDKRRDTEAKGKYHLFMDYVREDSVTRMEVQLNVKSCKSFNITVKDLIDLHKNKLPEEWSNTHLWNVFVSCCFNPSGTDFEILDNLYKDGIIRTKKRDSKKLEQELIGSIRDAKVMAAYAKKLHEYGFDVFTYLRRELSYIDHHD